MNIINRIKYSRYKELHELNIDEELLNKALSNPKFGGIYRNYIRECINGFKKKGIITEILSKHVNNLLKIYKNHTLLYKYINFVFNNSVYYNNPPIYFEVLNDKNYEIFFSQFRDQVFTKKMDEICINGYSDRLLELQQLYNIKVDLKTINLFVFSDKIWEIIKNPDNLKVGDKLLLSYRKFIDFNFLSELIDKNFFEGFKYTIKSLNGHWGLEEAVIKANIEKYDMKFINWLGDDLLKKLYINNYYIDKNVLFEKVLIMYRLNNKELLEDLLFQNFNFLPLFDFKKLSDSDLSLSLSELIKIKSSNQESKRNFEEYKDYKESMFQYFFAMSTNQYTAIKNFYPLIKYACFDEEFIEKHKEELAFLKFVFDDNITIEELLDKLKEIDGTKKSEYTKLFVDFVKDGIQAIKENNVMQIKNSYASTKNALKPKDDYYENIIGRKKIDVYELTGQPFMFLVHAITDNSLSRNNNRALMIQQEPRMWNDVSGGNHNISLSLINQDFMKTYGGTFEASKNGTVFYGFDDIKPNEISHMSTEDSGTSRTAEKIYGQIHPISYIFLNAKNTYNEIVISRCEEGTKNKRQPSYILCFNTINNNSRKAAAYFDIPIFLVLTKYYPKAFGYDNPEKTKNK